MKVCPACRSLALRSFYGGERGEAGPYTMCGECGWDNAPKFNHNQRKPPTMMSASVSAIPAAIASPPEVPALERMLNRCEGIVSAISRIEAITDRACGASRLPEDKTMAAVPNGMVECLEETLSAIHTHLLCVGDRLSQLA